MPVRKPSWWSGHNPNLSEFLGTVISDTGCEASVELEEGRGGESRNAPQLGLAAMVPDSKVLRTLYDAAVESSRPKTSRK